MRTLLLVAAQAIVASAVAAASDPNAKAALARRQSATYNWIGLVNCWTNPSSGARSELDFFNEKPSSFGSATPDARSVTSSNQNYVWEKGGSFAYGDQSDTDFKFSLDDDVKSQAAGAQVGSGSAGNTDYVIFKDKGTTLYEQPPYGCQIFYYAVPKDQAGSASGGSAWSASAAPSGPIESATPSSSPTSTSTSASETPTTSEASTASSTGSSVPSPTAAPENPTSTTAGSPAAAATQSSSPSTSAAPAAGASSSGLSSSASVGVGVGVGIGGAALLAAIGFLLWRHRGQRKENQALQNRVRGLEPGIENMGPAEKHGIDQSYHGRPPGIANGAARYS